MRLEIRGCMCFHTSSKNTLLRVTPAVTSYFVIAFDLAPGSTYGIYVLTFYSGTLSGILFRHPIWHLFWHPIWHPFWYLFWHFTRHSIWHSFWLCTWYLFGHSFLAPTLTYFLAYMLTFLSGILSDIYFDTLSCIYSGILSDILSSGKRITFEHSWKHPKLEHTCYITSDHSQQTRHQAYWQVQHFGRLARSKAMPLPENDANERFSPYIITSTVMVLSLTLETTMLN